MQGNDTPAVVSLLARALKIEPTELSSVAWSFLYFFCILSAYYMLRSVREAMAIVSGVQNIPWLFTGTFTIMLLAAPVFGWVSSRYPRKAFLPWVYYFFIANILIFFAAFTYGHYVGLSQVWISRAFFVWLSVFNLFVVSVFWSFMADIYSKEQSRRLFGVISAGGSTGALLGPMATSVLVVPIGFQNLLPLSSMLLLLAVYCVYRLRRRIRAQRQESADGADSSVESADALDGTALAGIRIVLSTRYFIAIAMALACANFLGGATYMYMAELVSGAFDSTDRQTQVFALLDALVNAFSLVCQLLIVKYTIRRFGIGLTLALLPIVSIIGFSLLAVNPAFILLAVLQVLRRSIGYGLSKPASDMLYSVVSVEAKYKAKNFIDTAVYRGWDLLATWTIRSLSSIGFSGVAMLCVPIAVIWTGLCFWIGREYQRLDRIKAPQ